MELRRVCVVGGSGFVGRHLLEALCAARYLVTVPTRSRERAKASVLLPTVDVVDANVHDPAVLAKQFEDADAVINLVGVLHNGRGNGGFEAAHVGLTRKVIAACMQSGVRRYIHMSALGADIDGPSLYQRSKGAAEKLVRDSQLAWTIFRPSVIFGCDDSFLNMFARLNAMLPVIFLAKADARFQPVFVEDVAAAFARSIDDVSTVGHSYDLGGPRVHTLREMVALVGRLTGHPRPIIGLPDSLSYLQACVLELLPGPLMSRDNVRSMQVDNVTTQPFPFGIEPVGLEAAAATWFGHSPRSRYSIYRDRSGRGPQ